MLAVSLLLIAGGTGHARKTPGSIAITAASKTGAVLIRVQPQPFDYQLTFQKEGSGGFGSRVYMIDVKPEAGSSSTIWQTRTLSPGRYVLKYVMQQKGWIGCLEDRTFLFDIKSGAVNYLGELDARQTLDLIQRSAGARGEIRAGGGQGGGIYYDVVPPILGGRAAGDLAEAQQFVHQEMPRTRAPLVLAPIEDHRFRTADDRNRRKRACN